MPEYIGISRALASRLPELKALGGGVGYGSIPMFFAVSWLDGLGVRCRPGPGRVPDLGFVLFGIPSFTNPSPRFVLCPGFVSVMCVYRLR